MGFDFDLITSDDGSTVIAKSVENLYILREKEKDAAVFGEITKIATENGIDTYLTLNEKAIIDAFQKQIPGKPHIPWDSMTKVYSCPVCIMSVSESDKYCSNCGKKLDWSEQE